MLLNMKTGELEAKMILNKLGYKMDESYEDDNSQESMPDLRMKNGRFVEVTHTKHNYQMSNFWKLSLENQINKSIECQKALDNIRSSYTFSEQLKQCRKVIKNHLGYDVATGKSCEFKCDIVSQEHSIENIIREIKEDKGKKHKNGDTDLFIFVSEDEFRLVIEATSSMINNLCRSFYESPFQQIWISKYEYIDYYTYNTDNPNVIILQKINNNIKVSIIKDVRSNENRTAKLEKI